MRTRRRKRRNADLYTLLHLSRGNYAHCESELQFDQSRTNRCLSCPPPVRYNRTRWRPLVERRIKRFVSIRESMTIGHRWKTRENIRVSFRAGTHLPVDSYRRLPPEKIIKKPERCSRFPFTRTKRTPRALQ